MFHANITRPADWAPFCSTVVEASATLFGLILLAVSINLDRIIASPALPDRALEALLLLFGALAISLLCLAPGQPVALLGAQTLAVAVPIWIKICELHVRYARLARRRYVKVRLQLGLLAQAATLPFVAAGLALITGETAGLYALIPGVLFGLLAVIANAWILLVEIKR